MSQKSHLKLLTAQFYLEHSVSYKGKAFSGPQSPRCFEQFPGPRPLCLKQLQGPSLQYFKQFLGPRHQYFKQIPGPRLLSFKQFPGRSLLSFKQFPGPSLLSFKQFPGTSLLSFKQFPAPLPVLLIMRTWTYSRNGYFFTTMPFKKNPSLFLAQ